MPKRRRSGRSPKKRRSRSASASDADVEESVGDDSSSSSSSEEEEEEEEEDEEDEDEGSEWQPESEEEEEQRRPRKMPADLNKKLHEQKKNGHGRKRRKTGYDLRPNPRQTRRNTSGEGDRPRTETLEANKILRSAILNAIAKTAKDLGKCRRPFPDEEERPRKRPRLDFFKALPAPPHPVETFDDLIKLARMAKAHKYQDCLELPLLLEPLEELQQLIGLTSIKDQLVNKVMQYCQRHHLMRNTMNHVVIVGPSGCGKTTVARCMAKLFNRMGHIKSSRIVEGNRRNMIGSYLGHTAKAVEALVKKALGQCLLIDECYSLGDGSDHGPDSYSKSCVDTLNQMLSEYGTQFLCIIVGYKESLKRDFFSLNPGLERRFPCRFEITPYKAHELSLIFRKMLRDQKLRVKNDKVGLPDWFQARMSHFKQSAGSVENLVDKIKVEHCRRVFGRPKEEKGVITQKDLDAGYAAFLKYANITQDRGPPPHMYI